MAGKRTVFVVGAGASSEFGLPVGRGLLDIISKTVTSSGVERGRRINLPERVSSALVDVIATNGSFTTSDERYVTGIALWIAQNAPLAPSIDNLLHSHENDYHIKACGKILIAHCISNAEKQSKLASPADATGNPAKWRSQDSNHWLGRVFWLLAEGSSFGEFKHRLSQIDFVTFNYDRCIEHFLLNAAASYFRLNSADLPGLKESLSVIHTYGHLGELKVVGRQMEGFGEVDSIIEAAKGLSTFTDGMKDKRSLEAIRSSLATADQVFFLGFGFLSLNMDLLFNDWEREKRPDVYGTAFHLSSNSIALLSHTIRSRVSEAITRKNRGTVVSLSAITVELHDLGCRELLDHYHFLLRS